jgi:PAS domain S-box-containing protein
MYGTIARSKKATAKAPALGVVLGRLADSPPPPEVSPFDTFEESVALFDQQERFVFVNRALLARLQKPREEVLGRCLWDLSPETLEDQLSGALRRVVATGKGERLEHYFGPWGAWFDTRLYPTTAGVYLIAVEIAAPKPITRRPARPRAMNQEEYERLASLFQQSPAAIGVVSAPDWVYEFSNAKNDELAGKGALVGRNIFEAMPELVSQGFAHMLDLIYRTGETFDDFEVKLKVGSSQKEREVYLNGAYQPIRNAAGNIDRIATFVHDVTEKVKARQRIEALAEELAAREAERDMLLERERLARAQAEQANRSKDDFLAMVSHELRTPLNAMLGWARMLSAGTLDPARQKRGLEVIERNAIAQAQLIEDLLDVSRIVHGKLRLEVSLIDFKQVVEAAIDSMRPAVESKGIQLNVVMEPSIGPLSGDAQRLQQVVWNLLSNAAKFTPKGGVIEVGLRRVDEHVELVVSDNGRGIAEGALPFVFDRFRQADASITRAYGGLGLGLSIAKHLAELHGGTIEAFSEGEGTGSRFKLTLCRDAGKPQAGKAKAKPAPPAPRPSPSEVTNELAGLRILVVDDEPDARELTSTILSQVGATVVSASSASHALRLLDEQPLDLMLSDIGMPELDGYELIRRVRALATPAGRIPAAALTAFARSDERRKAMLAGFQLHISKPVEPTELTAAVARLARIGNLRP